MEKITFQCETITPMFLFGADGKTPELRPPSIKGALRFWWRALNGHLSLDQLHKKEVEIFGGSGEGDNSTRSKVAIRVSTSNLQISSSRELFNEYIAVNPTWYRNGIRANVLEYLGYGVFDHRLGWPKYITPGSTFTISLEFNCNEILISEVVTAFNLLFSYGGIGSKSRNGFGQFKAINEDYLPLSAGELAIVKDTKYSFLSSKTKLLTFNRSFSTWQEALAKVGNIYRLSKLKLDGDKHVYKNRVYLNAPLLQARNQNIFKRKSKTHFISVHKTNDNRFLSQILNLPYYGIEFNPDVFSSRNINTDEFAQKLESVNNQFNAILLSHNDLQEVQL